MVNRMQIVIDIPEDDYYDALQYEELKVNTEFENLMISAIQDGTPLPKGHGRLIDADELKRHKYHDNNRFENAVAVAQVDWADTIIEADRNETVRKVGESEEISERNMKMWEEIFKAESEVQDADCD